MVRVIRAGVWEVLTAAAALSLPNALPRPRFSGRSTMSSAIPPHELSARSASRLSVRVPPTPIPTSAMRATLAVPTVASPSSSCSPQVVGRS